MAIRSRESLIGAWAFLIGVVLAVVVGILSISVQANTSPIILSALAALGVVVAYFVSEKDIQTFLIASVSIVVVSFAGMQGIVLDAAIRGVGIGKVVSSILGALLIMFVPAAVIVALKTVFSLAAKS
jgi:hypothetical protein